MDRRNYDAKTLAVFDTIGSFFIDVFYNSHYLFALDLVKEGKVQSITEAYRSTVINYMNGITKRPDLYMSVVKKMHEYYQRINGFGSIIFSDFEDKVLSQFIPIEYYRDFTGKHKDETLHKIIVKTVNDLGEIILKRDMLRRIIDDHMNRANVVLLQDRIVDIFDTQREIYQSKFVDEISRSNAGNNVSKSVLNKLKNAFVEEKKKRCDAENDKNRALNIISQLVGKITLMENTIKNLQKEQPDFSDNVLSQSLGASSQSLAVSSTSNKSLRDNSNKSLRDNSNIKPPMVIPQRRPGRPRKVDNLEPRISEPIKELPSELHDNESDESEESDESGTDSETLHMRQRERIQAMRMAKKDNVGSSKSDNMVSSKSDNVGTSKSEDQSEIPGIDDAKIESDLFSLLDDDAGW